MAKELQLELLILIYFLFWLTDIDSQNTSGITKEAWLLSMVTCDFHAFFSILKVKTRHGIFSPHITHICTSYNMSNPSELFNNSVFPFYFHPSIVDIVFSWTLRGLPELPGCLGGKLSFNKIQPVISSLFPIACPSQQQGNTVKRLLLACNSHG